MLESRWRQAILFVIIVSGVGCGIFAWQHLSSTPIETSSPPGIRETITDVEVRATLDRARRRVIEEPRSDEAWGELGLIFRAHRIHAESLACFEEAAKLNPDSPRWPYLTGTVTAVENPDAAIPHFRVALSLAKRPEDLSAVRLQMADLLLDLHKMDEAAELFELELASNPRNPRSQYGLGVIAVRKGNPLAATEHLLLAVESPHCRQKASALLAATYSQLKRTDEMKRCELQSQQPPADLPWPNSLDLGVTASQVGQVARNRILHELQKTGRHEEVVRVLQEMTRSSSGDQEELSLGASMGVLGDWAAAETIFRAVLSKTATHSTGRCCLGMSLYFQAEGIQQRGNRELAQKVFEEALVEFRKAIELKPDMGQAHLYACYCLKSLGRLTEAVEECNLAIQVMPQSADAHYKLGELLVKQGKSAAAVAHLENALRLAQPNDNRANTLLQQIRDKKTGQD
jgi:tetratricopeptide (TPR) repeat protein